MNTSFLNDLTALTRAVTIDSDAIGSLEVPAGFRVASVSNAGTPAGKVRVTFLAEHMFREDSEDIQESWDDWSPRDIAPDMGRKKSYNECLTLFENGTI